ncbi:MAG TPA: deoxyribonuclease IV [Candidatus Polarisedimenticolaceae bacterium]|nr:deoxyribonuclease IV [Candidatus Polarisedimenticolaceae bacterium]
MMPRLGAHMSIAGGMPKALERARSVEATALAVFVKSSNQWRARPLAEDEVATYRREARSASLDHHTLGHASYLINVASPDPALWEKSTAALGDELARCAQLGIPWLVVHPGSHVGQGADDGMTRIAKALVQSLARKDTADAGILLENTAGQGSALGGKLEELATILERANDAPRLGVCLDTCHALAAGYELRDEESYGAFVDAVDRAVGLSRVKGFHLNDSKGDLGSRLDRHEHIGKGRLGLAPFRFLLNDRRFEDVPMVLETEKGDDLAEDRVNLATLRSLVAR